MTLITPLSHSPTGSIHRSRILPVLLLSVLASTFPARPALAQALPVEMGSAANYAVLAGAGVADAGDTTITGDVGTFPTTTTAGFDTVTLIGTNQGGDAATQAAQSDLSLAYANASGQTPTTIEGAIFNLGGLTLTPGVYNDPSSFSVTGTLTLDAQGNPNAIWIFQAGSTLITAANSSISLINGAQASNVFWTVGSSATLGADTSFDGSILATTSITLGGGATENGGLYAEAGAVSLTDNTIDNAIVATPEPGTILLLGLGLAMVAWQRRLLSRTMVLKRVRA